MAEEPTDREWLEILCCPACDDRPKVELRGDKLVCTKCGREYPIRDNIPVMLVEEAEGMEARDESSDRPWAEP